MVEVAHARAGVIRGMDARLNSGECRVRHALLAGISALALFADAGTVTAADLYWNVAAGKTNGYNKVGNWLTSTNVSSGSAPTSADNLNISAGTVAVGAAAFAGTININGTGIVSVGHYGVLNASTLNVTGGEFNLSSGGLPPQFVNGPQGFANVSTLVNVTGGLLDNYGVLTIGAGGTFQQSGGTVQQLTISTPSYTLAGGTLKAYVYGISASTGGADTFIQTGGSQSGTVISTDYAQSSGTMAGTVNASTYELSGDGDLSGHANFRSVFTLSGSAVIESAAALVGVGTTAKVAQSGGTMNGVVKGIASYGQSGGDMGGTVTATNYDLSGGSLDSAGVVNLSGAFTLSSTGVVAAGAHIAGGPGSNVVQSGGTMNGVATGLASYTQASGNIGGSVQTASYVLTDASATSAGGSISASNQFLLEPASGTATVAATLSGTGDLVKSGAGAVVLTGANSFSGSVSIAAGTLEVQGGAAVPDNAAVNVANSAGAKLIVTNSETIGSLSGGGANGGEVAIADGAKLTLGNAGNAQFDGTMSGSTGALDKEGTGTFTLGGDVTLGGLSVNGGELQIGTGTSTNSASFESATIASGATLYVATGATLTIRVPDDIVNNGHLINNGTVHDDLANNNTFDNNLIYNANVASNTGTINNNTPGVWTGDVLTNNGGINNNNGAVWNGNIVSNSSYINNNAGATWNGDVIDNVVNVANDGGSWNGDVRANSNGTVFNTGPTAVWTGNVLTNNSQIVNSSGATWNGDVEGNNNAIFNLTGSFWNGKVVADGGGSNSLTQIDNYGTWTGAVQGNAAEINNLGGHWVGDITGNGGTIVNNYNDSNTNIDGVNAALWTGDVTSSGRIINDHGGRWAGDVESNTGLVINSTGATWTGNVVSNAGTLSNSGTWTGTISTSGVLHNYSSGTVSGLVTVSDGTTTNDGTMNGGAIVSGGRFTGAGTVSTVTVNSGGTFAPGNGSAGETTSVTGNLALTAGSTYAVVLDPATASSAQVGGTATLGGTLSADFMPGAYVTKRYDVLHAGAISGTFASLATTSLSATFGAQLSYGPTDVYLNLLAQLGIASNLDVNQQNTASAINGYFNHGGQLPQGFLNLFYLDNAGQAAAVSQLSGEAATGAQTSAFHVMGDFLSLLTDPFSARRTGASVASALGYADAIHDRPPISRWTVWGSISGSHDHVGENAAIGSHALDGRQAAVTAGAEYLATPATRFGFALSGAGGDWALAQGLGGGHDDAFTGGLYGVTHAGNAYVSGAVAFAQHWFTESRSAFAAPLSGSFDGQDIGARLEAGYRLETALGGVSPFGALQAQRLDMSGFTEKDSSRSSFALAYDNRAAADDLSELGLRFDRTMSNDGGQIFALQAKFAWAHEWSPDRSATASFANLPGSLFSVTGALPARDAALTTLEADWTFHPGIMLVAKFDGAFARDADRLGGKAELRVAW